MTRNSRSLLIRFAGVFAAALFALPVVAAQPITTDSRIKTLVYNANEVYPITTHYGYQSNIEFGSKENIETISVGDRVAWQVTPAGRRLFIRAQEENAHTNMTVVTNLRAYQFDLRSSSADAVFGSEQLTYVVRFFYPEDERSGMASLSLPSPPSPSLLSTSAIPAAAMPTPAFNYRYTYSGNGPTPVKVFDDGKSTYFKFTGAAPRISVITAKGETLTVPSRMTSDGLVAVNVVAPRFSLLQGSQQVIVYNESGGG